MKKLEQVVAEARQHPGKAASAVADYFTGYKFFKHFGDYVKAFRRDYAASTVYWGSLECTLLTASEMSYLLWSHSDLKRTMLTIAASELFRAGARAFFHYDVGRDMARWLFGVER